MNSFWRQHLRDAAIQHQLVILNRVNPHTLGANTKYYASPWVLLGTLDTNSTNTLRTPETLLFFIMVPRWATNVLLIITLRKAALSTSSRFILLQTSLALALKPRP